MVSNHDDEGALSASKRERVIALFLLIFSALLLFGAFYYPFVKSSFHIDLPYWLPDLFGLHARVKAWIIKEGQIPVGEQYLFDIIKSLFSGGSIFLGVVISLFSVVFPALKIVLCAIIVIPGRPGNSRIRGKIMDLIGHISKWSMADVFIVALVIVMFKAKGFNFEFKAEMGIYCYAASALLSSLSIFLVLRRFGMKEIK